MIRSLDALVRVLRELEFDFHVRTYMINFEPNIHFLVVYGDGKRPLHALWELIDWRLQAHMREVETDRFCIFVPCSKDYNVLEVR